MDKYKILKKALHRAIGKALKNGNQTVMKALDGMPDRKSTLDRVMADLDDSNDTAQVPESAHVSGGESVLNKEADPQKDINQNLQNIQHQKEMNAKAALGQMDTKNPQNKVAMSEEAPVKGVHKLQKFMDNRMAKSQSKRDDGPEATDKRFERLFNSPKHNEKGVHQPVNPKGGESKAGIATREAKANNNKPSQFHEGKRDRAKDAHKARLTELKQMPKPNLTKSSKSFDRAQHKNIKGVHTSGGFSGLEEKGQSQAGRNIERSKEKQPNEYMADMYHERGKQMHREKLAELKDMPKPKLTKALKLGTQEEYLPKLDHKNKKNHTEIKRRMEVMRSALNPQSREDHAKIERLSTLEHPSDAHMVEEAKWHLQKTETSK